MEGKDVGVSDGNNDGFAEGIDVGDADSTIDGLLELELGFSSSSSNPAWGPRMAATAETAGAGI